MNSGSDQAIEQIAKTMNLLQVLTSCLSTGRTVKIGPEDIVVKQMIRHIIVCLMHINC